jgi:Major tropism determinant N-terminal domain
MATQVQFRRGTTTQNNAFTGAAGEITYDTDAKTLRLHDGTTAGGGATVLTTGATQTVLNKTFSTGSYWQGNSVALAYGGTGASLTATPGAVPYSTASGMAFSLAGTAGQFLISGGTGSPTWVSGSALTVGTATTATSATNITGGSAGQLMIQQDTNVTTFITAGAAGTFLRSQGAGYAPSWATADVQYGNTIVALGGNVSGITGLSNIGISGTTTSTTPGTGALTVAGGVGVGGNVYVLGNVVMSGNAYNYLTLPVGNTAQRPSAPSLGMVRYNTTISSFEGYASGAWSSLGGVKSVDGFTYILAETSAGASNGELEFYVENLAGTAATKAGGWTASGLTVQGNLTVLGNTVTIGSNNLTINDSVIDLHTYANLAALSVDDGRDIGIRFHYYKTADKHAFLGWDNATGALEYIQDSTESNGGVNTGTRGNVIFGSLVLSNTTASTSNVTGALQVSGGAAITGNLNVGSGAYRNTRPLNTSYTGTSAPADSYPGDVWYDSASDTVFQYIYDGSGYQWVDTSGFVGSQANTFSSGITVTGAATFGAITCANITASGFIVPSSNLSINLGSTTAWWNNVYGVSVQAKYADLAEHYMADAEYAPGTVVIFGGTAEITTTGISHDPRTAGVVSTDPAYLMNAAKPGLPVALTGRVPCQVRGPVAKGDRLVTSDIPGVAERLDKNKYEPGCIIAKSLEDYDGTDVKTIEVAVGRY